MNKNSHAALERAIKIASEAHLGQRDKSGAPYIEHPLALMHQVSHTIEKIVAVLHDVIEDSLFTRFDLSVAGFSTEVIDAVDLLTHQKGESYSLYIERISKNELAKRVKILDLKHNMDISRLHSLSDKDFKRLQKYLNAWRYLTGKTNKLEE